MRAILVASILSLAALGAAHAKEPGETQPARVQIDYSGFRDLAAEVEPIRQQRLVALREFQRMAREPRTIILDARSADAYAEGHIDGAINLPLTDFTEPALRAALPDPQARILIYCNNNFSNNVRPVVLKRLDLALNIQTFINLHGYGYRNVYELAGVVDFNDPAVRWVRQSAQNRLARADSGG